LNGIGPIGDDPKTAAAELRLSGHTVYNILRIAGTFRNFGKVRR